MAFADTFLPEFDQEMKTTRSLLERVPLDKGDWKPHTRSTGLGALAAHLVGLSGYGLMIVEKNGNDVNPAPGTTRPAPTVYKTTDELLEAFDKNVKKSRDALAAMPESELMTSWTLKAGDHVIFSLPRAAVIRTMLLNHMIHHRGQLSVYLRLNDVPLPSIYGPSADT